VKLTNKSITIFKTIETILSLFFHILHIPFIISSVSIFYLSFYEISILKSSLKNTFLLFPNTLPIWLIIFELAIIYISIWIFKNSFLWHSMFENTLENTTI